MTVISMLLKDMPTVTVGITVLPRVLKGIYFPPKKGGKLVWPLKKGHFSLKYGQLWPLMTKMLKVLGHCTNLG